MDDALGGEAGAKRPEGAASEDAVRALVSLGYPAHAAEGAVRTALEGTGRGASAPELIRAALTKLRS